MHYYGAARSGIVFACVIAGHVSGVFAQSDSSFNAQVDNPAYSMLVQPNGKVLLGGQFTSLDGAPRQHLGRLNADGSLDTLFNPGADGLVYTSVLLTNGQILVGGSFTNLAGQPRNHLGRLNADGTLDSVFNPGADGSVYSLLVQSDGKIVVAGTFTNLGGHLRNSIGRLNGDGSPDGSFSAGASNTVYTLALQPDGKILAGGAFLGVNGLAANYICRLNTNGTLDTNFVASSDDEVHSLAVQADGKIMAGGLFLNVNGQTHLALARLNANGTLDTNFTGVVRPGYLGDSDTLAIQSDGKILVGGTAIGWFEFPYFARFNSDGSSDTNFSPVVPSGVHSIALQRDGKILDATFYTLGRLTNAPVSESLVYTNSNITWLRGGSSPEAWRTTFESSTNLINWTSLGAGTRIAGGWQRTGVSAPVTVYIRARGFVTGGYHNASQTFVEAYAGPVTILTQPGNTTNNAGTTTAITVQADGSPTLGYRWRKNGTYLSDGGNVSGATNATLNLAGVLHADAAAYSVVVSNSFGAVTSAVANLTVIDPFISVPPTDQHLEAGQTAVFSVSVAGTAALNYQWLRNGVAIPGQTSPSLTLTNVQGADAGSTFSVVVTNSFGSMTSSVALLTVNVATVDAFSDFPNYPVRSIAVQPDGKILMSGLFSFVNGQVQSGIARLNSDGNLDANFSANLLGIPFSNADPLVALQPDGKILLAGGISYVNGAPRNRLARLNPDGSLDSSFDPGASDDIYAMTVQPDGKIVVGGSFTNLAGQSCGRIGRLNADGTLDTNFTASADGTVYAMTLQADGKVLVGGSFTNLAGQARANFGRFNTNGTADPGFAPAANATVNAIAVLANGSIAVGGNFTSLAGQPRNYIGRLDANGALDAAFNPNLDGPVESLAVQVDGRLILGGTFSIASGQNRTNLARLNGDGSADAAFNPGADSTVRCVAVQPDGKVIVAGSFGSLDGHPQQHVGRLNNTSGATINLTFTSTTITWQRSGAGPEVWRTLFEVTTNGTDWVQQNGTRIAGGWQATGLNLASNATVRARGFVAGSSDGSSWFVESVVGPPVIVSQPASRTNNPFTLATFAVNAVGQEPLSYHWLKNGIGLNDGSNIAGALGATLKISNVLGGDTAIYQVVVSNAFGSITSTGASLTVLDPMLTVSPTNQTGVGGQNITFGASAIGTLPIRYQWLKGGTNLADGGNVSGAQTQTLTLSNVLGGDAGGYQVVAGNVWGSTTSVVATLNVIEPVVISNPASQFAQRGQTVNFNVSVLGTPPLSYSWRKSGIGLLGATNSSLTLTNIQAADVAGYDVVVSDAFGSVTSLVASLTINLATADSWNPGANGAVNSLAIQADGRIIVGGSFTTLAGQSRTNLGRLNADATLDTAFNANANGLVTALGMQADGKIVVGGSFTSLAGQACTNLGRLNADGKRDAAFNPVVNGGVNTVAVQADGGILVGGRFTSLGGQVRQYIGRLDASGVLDTNFNPVAAGSPYSPYVNCLVVQGDGRILVGGWFLSLGNQSHIHLGRLNSDGTVDGTFNPDASGGAYPFVNSLAPQADGKILVGGYFNSLAGQAASNLGRLNSNGTPDTNFNCAAGDWVYNLTVQTDGKILVGGLFLTLGGQNRSYLGRLNADGTTDSGFNPGASGAVSSMALQTDGRIVIAGGFTNLNGQPRANLARLNNSDPATQSLAFDGTNLTWLRGGTSQEVSFTHFETSTTGTNWTDLGAGLRIADGWQLNGLALSVNATIRARGFTSGGGYQSSSSWNVESVIGPPVFLQQPAARTNNAATTAMFGALATGGPPLSYQWLKNGVNLQDGGNVSGALTPALTLTNVFGGDAGGYSVIASNAAGSLTSSVALLTVVDPLLTSQPLAVVTNAGQTVSFGVNVVGTSPISYQWRKNGTNQPAGTNALLTIINSQSTDAGNYDVIVSNTFGSVTSAVASLMLNLAVPDSLNPGANGAVNVLGVQPDGKILVGGQFSTLGGQPRGRFGRLNPDGTLDTLFNPGAGSGTNGVNGISTYSIVTALLVQPDGNIVLAGAQSERQTSISVWRIDSAGNADTNFVTSFNGSVNALALQNDGKIWAGGSFTLGKPLVTTNLARLIPNGTLDTNIAVIANSSVNALALQPDGGLLVGGAFTTLDGTNRNRIARLNPDGTLNTNFNPNANNTVNALTVQADGKIVVGGIFNLLGGTNRNRIARLNADGTIDANFNPNANNTVSTLALQTDGKILIGGSFTTVGGLTRSHIARLNPDGSVDGSFNPGANGFVTALAIQADGAIIVGGGGGLAGGGGITVLGGFSRTNIGRLVNSEPAAQNLSFSNSTVTWLRGGTSPEVWRTTFEDSTNGTDWVSLGQGGRVSGGWLLTGISIPARTMVRARGFVSSGINNGSGWFVESIEPKVLAPEILAANGGLSFNAGLFGFNVQAVAGQVVVIEASADFIGWIPIQTNLVTALGQFQVMDPQSSIFPRRFYRARLYTGILPVPSLNPGGGHLGFTANGFGFNLAGVAGQTVVIDYSTNLSLWTALATNTLGTGLFDFTDAGATNSAYRFYRLRLK